MTEADLSGSTLAGKFRILGLLGQGGMGAVYEGEHIEMGKRVAIKVIRPEYAASEEVAERFRREARAASKVVSEGIVQVFDIGRDPTAGLYMVMELLAGEDLSQKLARDTKLDVAVAVDVAIQAARALTKAHSAGVVHRDLKPGNLFLTKRDDGSLLVKVLDFGISKLAKDARTPDTQPTSPLTRTGIVIGTAEYMSPEQAQGLAVDLRTDVWSLGVVLYEALAGQPVFAPKDTYEQMIIQIVTTRPRPLSSVAPWVPTGVASVVDAALTPELEARLPDCAELGARLERVAGDLRAEGGAPPVTPTRVVRGTGEGVAVRAPAAASRVPWVSVALGAACLAAVAVAAGRALHHDAPSPGSGLVQSVDVAPSAVIPAAPPSSPPAPTAAAASAGAPSVVPSPSAAVPPAHSTRRATTKSLDGGAAAKPGGQIGGLGATTEY
jgi:serine/threonine protein kinase